MLSNLRIVAGKMDTPPPASDMRTPFVGACAAGFKDLGDCVKGCPPNNVDITTAITGTSDHDFFARTKE